MRLYDHIVHRSDQLTISFSFHLSFCLFVCQTFLFAQNWAKGDKMRQKQPSRLFFKICQIFLKEDDDYLKELYCFVLKILVATNQAKGSKIGSENGPFVFLSIFLHQIFLIFFNEGIEISFHNQNHQDFFALSQRNRVTRKTFIFTGFSSTF